MTNIPRDRTCFCGLSENIFLGLLFADGTAPVSNPIRLSYSLYNSAGGLIVSNTSYVASAPAQGLIFLDVSPDTLISQTAITSVNFDSCAYYLVTAKSEGSGSYTGASESFKITIDTECKSYTTRRLHWLNKFGVWDSFTFSLVSTESTAVKTHDFKKESGLWGGTSYTYPLYEGELTGFNKTSTDSMILNSDWIHESLQNWLVRSLYESPLVYLEQATGYEPVIVNNANYLLKQRRKDGLIQEAVEIKRTYEYQSQFV